MGNSKKTSGEQFLHCLMDLVWQEFLVRGVRLLETDERGRYKTISNLLVDAASKRHGGIDHEFPERAKYMAKRIAMRLESLPETSRFPLRGESHLVKLDELADEIYAENNGYWNETNPVPIASRMV